MNSTTYMKNSLLLTILIFATSIAFFSYWWYSLWSLEPYIVREFSHSLYKLIFQAWPMLLFLLYIEKKSLYHFFWRLFSSTVWIRQRWIYVIFILWGWGLILYKSTLPEFSTHFTFFAILVVNSVVEESVFRWYIQTNLISLFGQWRWIWFQSLLFALVHIPFYYVQYTQWVYSTRGAWLASLLWISHTWSVVVLLPLVFVFAYWIVWWWMTYTSKSLWPAIILHSIHNGVLLFL